MLLSGIAFGICTSDDGMQAKWFIMLGIKYAQLSVLNVADTALYQFKRQNL